MSILLHGPEQPEPEENGDLAGKTQQEQLPHIEVEKHQQGEMDTQQKAPDDHGDQDPVPPEIPPGRPQTQQHDGIDGNGIEKGNPAVGQVKG